MTHYAERREFCWHKTANLEGAKSYFISDCPFIYYLSVSNYYPFDCVFAIIQTQGNARKHAWIPSTLLHTNLSQHLNEGNLPQVGALAAHIRSCHHHYPALWA